MKKASQKVILDNSFGLLAPYWVTDTLNDTFQNAGESFADQHDTYQNASGIVVKAKKEQSFALEHHSQETWSKTGVLVEHINGSLVFMTEAAFQRKILDAGFSLARAYQADLNRGKKNQQTKTEPLGCLRTIFAYGLMP